MFLASKDASTFLFAAVTGLIGTFYVLLWPASPSKTAELVFYANAFIAAPVLAVIAQRWFERIDLPVILPLIVNLSAAAFLAAALIFIFLGPQSLFVVQSWRTFALGSAAALALSLASLNKPPSKPNSVTRLFYLAAAALALMMFFDYRLVVETMSYGPYIGPALGVLHGGIPMLDVFSQYGLSYLVFAWVFIDDPHQLLQLNGLVSKAASTFLFAADKCGKHRDVIVESSAANFFEVC